LVLLAALVVLFLNGRQQTGTVLQFIVVGADEMGQGGQLYPQTEPKLVIVTQPEEASQLDDTVKRTAQQDLAKLDYGRVFALVVFQGLQLNSPYSVEVQSVRQKGGVIVIEALFHTPVPDMQMFPIEISPYQIIAVDRPRTTMQDFEFTLNVGGVPTIKQMHRLP
jgi:hypothetical protein